MEAILDLLAQNTHWWSFGLLLGCGLGLPPWSEEVVLIGTGYFVAHGSLGYSEAVAWCLAGILAGDSVLWCAGRLWGERAYEAPVIRRHLPRDGGRRARFQRRFDRHASWALFVARFVPGYRMLAYLLGGIQGFPYLRFLLLDLLGALLTGPLSIWAGWHFAEELGQAVSWMHQMQLPVFALLFLAVGGAVWLGVRRRRSRYTRIREERRRRDSAPAASPGPATGDGREASLGEPDARAGRG